MRTPKDIQDILRQVRSKLDAQKIQKGVALQVAKDGFVEDDDWLSVVVSPAAKGIRAYDYVEILGQVEKELRDDGVDHVVLVPAMAD
jgi:hypothetical protein